jgi:hypothetical protein
VLNRGLKVMDSTAITLCMDNELPIVRVRPDGSSASPAMLAGEHIGTVVSLSRDTVLGRSRRGMRSVGVAHGDRWMLGG